MLQIYYTTTPFFLHSGTFALLCKHVGFLYQVCNPAMLLVSITIDTSAVRAGNGFMEACESWSYGAIC